MYEKNILDAIQMIVDNAISKASFDKTIQCTISKCVDEKNGKYVVVYQDSSFYAYSSNIDQTYSAGTSVYVLVPRGDMSNTKTIIGSVNKLGSDYINTVESIDKYDTIGNTVVTLNAEQGICSYTEGGDALVLYDKTAVSSLINLDTVAANTYIKQSDYLVLGGKFRTNLKKEQRYKGNYGLGFDINFTDNMTGETVKRTYLVNINNMLGNPYEYINPSEQKIVFNIDGANFVDIDKIYLYCYDFPNETSQEKPDDIFVSDIIVQAAAALTSDELAGNKINLIAKQGLYFDNYDTSTATRKIETEIKIDNKIVNKNSSLLKYYWFKENYSITSSDVLYNRYGKNGWECLNNYNIIEQDNSNNPTLIDWITTQPSLIIKKTDVIAKDTNYKCVVSYNNEIVLTKTFTIYNYSSNYNVSIASDSGVNFSYDNGKPTLTCSVTPSGNYTYDWGMIDSGNNYSDIQETTTINTQYHTAVNDYNTLKEGLSAGTIPLTAANQQELVRLKNLVEQYDDVMRVEDNIIYNLKLNKVYNFATFVCYVKLNGVYVGKGSIKITNNLNTSDNSYSLVINNANQVFKYNGDGISPASKSLDNPQEIYPLSFVLYDEKGNAIDDAAIPARNIFWTVPTTNTMIKVSDVHGNPTSVDEFNETATYTEYREFFFEIPTTYNNNKTRNNIQLEVRYKDKIIRGKTDLIFLKEGEAGSNGTDFVCRVVPNVVNDSSAPIYPIVTYNINGVEGSDNPTINFTPAQTDVWFKAQLFKDGEQIFSGPVSAQSSEGKNVTIQWEMLKNKYGKDFLTSTSIEDVSNFSVNSSTGVFSFNNLNSVSDITLKNNPSNIVKCTLTYDGVDYIATMPIILAKVNNLDRQYRIDQEADSGFRYVMYSTDGKTPVYSSSVPFALRVYETIEGVERDVSTVTETAAVKVNYTWSRLGAIWNGTQWVTDYNLVEKIHSSANPLAHNEKDFKPVDSYNGLTVNNGVKCVITRSGDQLAEVYLPIHFYLNRYGNSALNGWDGNHITIDEDGGFILSPQIGAGRKESDNTYTGLFMGEVRESNSSDTKVGLFGYNSGQKTIELNAEDGSARFGATNQGQIVIDPGLDTAKLYSDDYQVGYISPSDMIPAQTKYVVGYSYWRKNGNNYALLKALEDYIEGYYYNGSFYEDSIHSILITPTNNQKYYDLTNKKCYKYSNNSYQELTNYYKNGDTIKSTDWVWAGGDGLEIDLNDPHIRFGSGKFRVDSDGQVYATGFVNVIELENGDYNIPGMKNFQLEYPMENVQFETNVKQYPTSTGTKSISCKVLYKDIQTDDYTVNLIDNQGNVITHDTTHNTDTDGISIGITKNLDGTAVISFTVNSSKKILNAINSYLVRFTYTATGDIIDKAFGVSLIIRGTSITVNGSYNSLQDLLDDVDQGVITPSEGDAYVINGDLYVYTNAGGSGGTSASDWEDVGRFTGESAKQCVISATSEAFKSNDGGITYTPNSITITPFFQNVNYSSWAYSTNGGASFTPMPSTFPTGISMDNNTKALTISNTCELFSNNITILVFKCLTDDNDIYDTRTIMKIKDGVNGVDGYSIWTTTTTPTTPNYTFTIANLVGPSGKTPAIGEVIIQSNRYQYTISETATTTVKADTRVDLKGANGDNGYNTATVNLYGRFDSTPNVPYSESVTYTFATHALSSIPTGWSQSVPAIDSDKKLYVSSAVAYGNAATVAIGAAAWSSPVVMAENGSNGESPTFITCGNEAQTLVCDSSGAVTADTLITIPFAGYIGNSRAACNVSCGTLPGTSGEVVIVSNTAATTSADGSLVLKVNATATLGGVTNGDIELTFTCNSKTFIKKFSWAKSLTGTAGYNTAIVNLYKRGTSASGLGAPYNTSVNYIFATQSLSSAPLNNWSQAIPEGTNPLYVTSAIAYSNTGTDGIATTDWSTPTRILQNGEDGGNTATVNLYQRSASAPSAISGSTTYTFADQSLSPLPSGWSQTIPSGDNPLYITTAIAYSKEASVSITSTKWSTPTILAENGLDGKSIVVDSTTVEYQNSSSGTTIPSGSWSSSPSPTAGEYMWTKTTTTYKLAETSTSAGSSISYAVAYIGEDGDIGEQGVSVVSITPIYYLKTTLGAPQAPSAHVTSTSTNPNQWTTVIPVYDTGATYYTCNEVLYDDNTYGTNGYVWTSVVADNGVNVAIATADDAKTTVESYDSRITEAEDSIEALSKEVIPLSREVTGANSITLEDPYPGVLHRLFIYGDMNLVYPQSINDIVGSAISPNNTLTCGNVIPSQPVAYNSLIKYPNSSLYTKSSILLVNESEYELDINFLNYLSSEIYDEFVYEEERSYIIRRVGVDSQGEKYALNEEIVEERKHIPIQVSGDTIIQLKSITNMVYDAEYLINNVYTDTFTTNWELISRINMSPEQIEIASNKISLEGKTIDLTGDTINIDSSNFKVDTEGNIWANESTFTRGNFTEGRITLKGSGYSFLNIRDDNNNLLMRLDSNGQEFWNPSNINQQVGSIGMTDAYSDSQYIGKVLAFTLKQGAKILWFAPQQGTSGYAAVFGYDTITDSLQTWRNITIPGTVNKFLKGSYIDSFSLLNNYLFVTGDNGLSYNVALNSSDGRFKENIENTNVNALDIINQIKFRQFDWKQDKKHEKLGFIAQELEQVDNNLVIKTPQKSDITDINEKPSDYLYQININNLVAYLTKAVNELSLKIEQQQKQIEFLMEQLNLKYEEEKKRDVKKGENIQQDYGVFNYAKPKKIKSPQWEEINGKLVPIEELENEDR